MTALLILPVTTAVSAQVGAMFQLREQGGNAPQNNIALQGAFTYGSGGTTATAWVQTSLDGGGTWCDVASFAFTTASLRKYLNASFLTSKLTVAGTTITDGSLAADIALDGLFGTLWRVKYTTTGTYAGGTVLRVDAICAGLTAL